MGFGLLSSLPHLLCLPMALAGSVEGPEIWPITVSKAWTCTGDAGFAPLRHVLLMQPESNSPKAGSMLLHFRRCAGQSEKRHAELCGQAGRDARRSIALTRLPRLGGIKTTRSNPPKDDVEI